MLNIKSVGETLNATYRRPNPQLVSDCVAALKEYTDAMRYLTEDRGLEPATIEHFKLGYSTRHNAISIPIYKDGELINIKYRLLNPNGKAKYTSEAGAENWVYNEDGFKRAAKHRKVLVVEGEFDCMVVWQSGIKNVVSPASGKNSYGPWVELLDEIPAVYIAYDNDPPGRETAKELAEIVGYDKSYKVQYPEDIKDASDYFKTHDLHDFRLILEDATPFVNDKYKGLGDIITNMRNKVDDATRIPFIPNVEIERDWMTVIIGRTNVGKTSYMMNVVEDLAKQGKPVLIFPFERGIDAVGKRLLQVKFDKTKQEFQDLTDEGWDKIMDECREAPIYFSMAPKEEFIDTVIQAKRFFGIQAVVVDHFDYLVRGEGKESDISKILKEMKLMGEEHKIQLFLVSHIRKIDQAGSLLERQPGVQDVKGSSSLYNDPECFLILKRTDNDGELTVEVAKNKGEMTSQTFDINDSTGKMKVSLFDSM